MRYFVAHLLSGDVQRYYNSLSRDLSLRYRIAPLYERVPAHITIKPPFDTDEDGIKIIERALRSFAGQETPKSIAISKFGHFGYRTIYLDIEGTESIALMRRVVHFLDLHVPFMPKSIHGNKPHVSIGRFLTRVQSRRIWRYVKTLSPNFSTSLDNIAILKKDGKRWVLHSLIPIGGSEEGFLYMHPQERAEAQLL